jgi:hypothetical protein
MPASKNLHKVRNSRCEQMFSALLPTIRQLGSLQKDAGKALDPI